MRMIGSELLKHAGALAAFPTCVPLDCKGLPDGRICGFGEGGATVLQPDWRARELTPDVASAAKELLAAQVGSHP